MRNDIINAFDKKVFPYKDSKSKTKEEKPETKSEEGEELKKYINNTLTFIEEKSEGINNLLFEKHFNFSKPINFVKALFETKDKEKNKQLVEGIMNGWRNLRDNTKNMSKIEDIENEKPNQILEIVKWILDFNKEIQKQEGSGLKILTPNQMLSRLPISLAQLKAGNILKNLKTKLDNYCILCTDQKNLQSNSIKV